MPKEDITVHRYKFSDWTPSPIKCLAVDPFSGLIAVGRDDGDIELTHPAQSWFIQARIIGKEGFALKNLAFSPLKSDSGRLFGSSLCGFVFEVDFESLTLKNVRDSYGGAVWALASSPRGAALALGCEDKTVKLFSYAGSSSLEYEKSFASTGSRVLSVAFNPVVAQVLAGCADGTIRCYDEVTGSSLFRLTGDTKKGMKMSMCIWSLVVLADEASTIVSGDSQGKLQFWNGKSGDLLCSIHQHSASIQCIAASEDQNTIFASGVDSRVVCIQRLSQQKHTEDKSSTPSSSTVVSRSLPSSDRWVYTSAHRPHSHDVYALAIAPRGPSSGSAAIAKHSSNRQSALSTHSNDDMLISGGLDCKVCIYSTSDFAGCRPNWILPIPGSGVASASLTSDSGIVSVKHRTHVDLWALNIGKSSSGMPACENSCRIQLKSPSEDEAEGILGRDHIHSAVVSPSGEFIAITCGSLGNSSSSFRLFHITTEEGQGTKVRRVKLDPSVEKVTNSQVVSCQAVSFSSSGQSVAVVTTAAATSIGSNSTVSVLLLDIAAVVEDPTAMVALHHTFKHSKLIAKALKNSTDMSSSSLNSSLVHSVKSMSFSSDDRWMAVSSSANRVFVYEIDRLSLHWVLPCFAAPVTCVAFHPSSPNSLLTSSTSDSSPFLIYDVQKKDLSDWSQANTDIIPNWKSAVNVQSYGPIQNITFDPSCESAFMLYGQGFSIYVDLNLPIVTLTTDEDDTEGNNGKCRYVHKGQVSVLTSGVSKSTENGGDDANIPTTRKKRRKGDKTGEELAVVPPVDDNAPSCRNFSVIKAYRSLVFAALLGDKEMVVVENPWVRILENLPATLSRKRFGT